MPPYFPHAPYAEDQPLARTLLTVHVLHRGFQTGAFLGPPLNLLSRFYFSRRHPSRAANLPLLPSMIRTTGVASAVGTGALTVALVGRMWGREEIEWKDRSWRLLENKGQQECDVWSMWGTGVGVGMLGVVKAVREGRGLRGWKIWVGAAGAGNVLGVLGYMGFRYGYKGGKWEEGEVVG